MVAKLRYAFVAALCAAILHLSSLAEVRAANIGTAFTYQGFLEDVGGPVTADCDFQFGLWDAAGSGSPPTGGNQIGVTQTVPSVPVDSGVFTVGPPDIDFGGAAFNGTARWLEIAVRCPTGVGSYETLSPRVEMTPVPYALALPGLYTEQNGVVPNLIGGFPGNTVTAGAVGATISGGGNGGVPNRVTDSMGAVGGGSTNQAGDNAGTTEDRAFATVGGGVGNTASGAFSTVGGGQSNSASGDESCTVAGGVLNTASGHQSTVSGGSTNTAGGTGATVGGGEFNTASGNDATIGGGISNVAGQDASTVGGGTSNSATGYRSTVGGGDRNTSSGPFSTIAGGFFNSATMGYATTGGGNNNTAGGIYAAVGGGLVNTANGEYSTVAGGHSDAATGNYSIVGGGSLNTASGNYSTVGGGQNNSASGKWSALGGGQSNSASGDESCTVAGGVLNTASGRQSTVSGGIGNTASGMVSMVPGGQDNVAGGHWSFAGGRRAKVRDPAGSGDSDGDAGTFVWADSTDADFTSTGPDRFLVRASNGTTIYSDAGLTAGVTLAAGGGSWGSVSDRNLKENFAPVDKEALLEKLSAISVTTWNYKSQSSSIRHMGPMGQDFYAAFGVGEEDTKIGTIDADGVALAAIQGLYQIVREKDCEIDELRSEISHLKSLVETLAGQQNGGSR